MLKLTNRGVKVRNLQTQLNILGYDLSEDGVFGRETLTAVKAFQAKSGIDVDGIVGRFTEQAILNALNNGLSGEPQSAHFCYMDFISCDDTETMKNGIPQTYWMNIQMMMDRLELVREAMGGLPIAIRSGYRSPAYNKRVGGARTSQHLYGKAADIHMEDYTISCYHLAKRIYLDDELKSLFGGFGLGSDINLHVDIRKRSNPLKPAVWWYGKKSWKEWSK